MTQSQEQLLATSKGHQWLALIGVAFVAFEAVFIWLYSDNFWFSLDLRWFGVPAALCALAIAHGVLVFGESKYGCKWTAALCKGKPPVVYKRWLELSEDGFTCGLRHIRFDVVTNVELTWFGNLCIYSRALCGSAQPHPDLVFKFAFSPASQPVQRQFVDAMLRANPTVLFNDRLTKRLSSPVVRGQNLVQALGALMMLVLLIDLGYSSFYYLEMLKHYFLAETLALSGDSKAGSELASGDEVRAHPLPISYITTRFLNVGSCAAGLSAARADALWDMGRKDEAIAEIQKAIADTPEAFREYLHYARFLEESGKPLQARAQIEKAIEKHKDSLLPRLYLMAYAKDNKPKLIAALYRQTMDDMNDRYFNGEPHWPPGGDTFVHDLYYSGDIYFVFNRLLGVQLKPPPPDTSK